MMHRDGLQPLRQRDYALLRDYCAPAAGMLSACHPVAVYLWQSSYRISWQLIAGCLCIFFEDSQGCFLYLPPLGGTLRREVIEACFAIMNARNRNPAVSRIENISAAERPFYAAQGLVLRDKQPEYVYARQALAELRGNRYKSPRAACNRFRRQWPQAVFRTYAPDDRAGCLALAAQWVAARRGQCADSLYQAQLTDFQRALGDFFKLSELHAQPGWVVCIDGTVRAFLFGYGLSERMFCVLFEIGDLRYTGIAPYIFRQVCAGLPEYDLINCMDDSYLESLRRAKQRYHPLLLSASYLAVQAR
ncbi:MAG: phosphatidylglycerol lysyltransferase domain-containing protein [Candidatus Omnitrophica bacterium]|nr:phosphatidylglycerol lysyltransferase domain-containing protein [Candidatus Omnitrophota bacterium]